MLGCLVQVMGILATVAWIWPGRDLETGWRLLAPWFVVFVCAHLLRVLVFLVADFLLIYASPLFWIPVGVGYMLTLMKFAIDPRIITFNLFVYLVQIAVHLAWNLPYLLVARHKLRAAGTAGRTVGI